MNKTLQQLILFMLLLLGGGFAAGGQVPGTPVPGWMEETGETIFGGSTLPHMDDAGMEQEAMQYLKTLLPELQAMNAGLQRNTFKQSRLGTHIEFSQTYKDIEIFGTTVKVNIGKDRRVLSVTYKTADTRHWDADANWPQAGDNEIKAILPPHDSYTSRNIWYYNGGMPLQAYYIEYGKEDGSLHEVMVVDQHYTVMYRTDKLLHLTGPDTTATGYVFYPDPLTSSQRPYGNAYADHNDSAVAELNLERVPKQMKVTYHAGSGQFRLENEYVIITELSSPVTNVAVSNIPLFNYSRSEDGFEDVNVYYHINNFIDHVKQLGYDDLVQDYQLRVDAHALGGDDQSEFSYFNGDLKLHFGEGGIDDAEDADVIVHEYCHYLSYRASPNTVSGSEREALEEGLCDYFACSYSRAISEFNWERLYNWDGNETWKGREATNNKKYPEDLEKNRYRDGTIWSGALMGLWEQLGRNTTDELMLGTLYLLGKQISMADAASMMMQTDTLLYEGEHAAVIKNVFVDKGLIPDTQSAVAPGTAQQIKLETATFPAYGYVTLELPAHEQGVISLYDLSGRELAKQVLNGSGRQTFRAPAGIKPGIYLLNVSAGGYQQTVKLIKY